jgi:hypothetical protein
LAALTPALTLISGTNVLRWSIGAPGSPRSSPIRVWGNRKGDIYLAARALGKEIKASFHRDGNSQIGFTSEYADIAQARFGALRRHWATWRVPNGRPIVQVAQLVVPEAELRVFTERSDDEKLTWLPPPARGSVGVVVFFFAPPANTMRTPRNARCIGSIQTQVPPSRL